MPPASKHSANVTSTHPLATQQAPVAGGIEQSSLCVVNPLPLHKVIESPIGFLLCEFVARFLTHAQRRIVICVAGHERQREGCLSDPSVWQIHLIGDIEEERHELIAIVSAREEQKPPLEAIHLKWIGIQLVLDEGEALDCPRKFL